MSDDWIDDDFDSDLEIVEVAKPKPGVKRKRQPRRITSLKPPSETQIKSLDDLWVAKYAPTTASTVSAECSVSCELFSMRGSAEASLQVSQCR